MNKSLVKVRSYELWYLIGAMAIALLLYTGLKWYQLQTPGPTTPQSRAALIQHANQYYLRANDFYRQANHQEALPLYQKALSIYPQHAPSHTMISMIHMRTNNFAHAFEYAQKAISADSSYVPAYLALGQCHLQQNKPQDAKVAYQNAVRLDPKNFESNLLLSQLCTQEMTPESCAQAIAYAQQALSTQPTNAEARFALGDAYLASGQPRDARINYEQINDSAQNHRKNLYIGQTYQREQNFIKAADYYQQSIADRNTFPQAHVALAGAYFALGKLGKGFQEYEWRWQLSNMRDLQNKWANQDLKGKRLIVLSENGIGDIIQYVRFAQCAKSLGAHVTVVAPQPLLKLFAQCSFIDGLIPTGSQITEFDYITSMQSIPAVLNINEHILPNKPYIFADAKLVAEWKQKLAHDRNFKIGICWQPGDDSYMGLDQKRGLSLELLKPLARDGISFYCLQMGGTTNEQIKSAPFNIHTFDETFDKTNGGFMDTAAVMKNMDLIITVDTSVGHLAGALGVPTWILLSYAADVRWMVNTDKSIWYPSFTLFRQTKMGDWESVIKQVKNLLNSKVQ